MRVSVLKSKVHVLFLCQNCLHKNVNVRMLVSVAKTFLLRLTVFAAYTFAVLNHLLIHNGTSMRFSAAFGV